MLIWKSRTVRLIVAAGLTLAGNSRFSPLRRAHGADLVLAANVDPVTTIDAIVPRNATLQSLLERQRLPTDVVAAVVDAVRGVFNPRALRADRPYQLTRSIDGLFREFRYEIDADNALRVDARDHAGDGAASFDAAIVPIPKDYRAAAVSASISPQHRSIIDAFSAAGETVQLPLALAEVFGGELDFNTDLHMGDRVDVLFDRAWRSGAAVGYGAVKAAVIDDGPRRLTAIRFTGADGQSGWYDEQGRSLARPFLKSPLPFDPRVTSGFSPSRMHPILGIARPHLGVDFGAPYGTAVKAVAAGVIEVAAMSGEAGRMVRIRHAGGYETAYLHLSSFAPGIRPGARVDQGQLIGRVGQSGLATGPHLDYRVIRNGVYVNPLTAFSRMPEGRPLAPSELPTFARERDARLNELQARLGAAGPNR